MSIPSARANQHPTLPAGPHEFLAFTLGKEEYGIDIQNVQELRSYDAVTRLANAPEFIKGVVNLRGIIVPIIDMRIKFSLGTPAYHQFTVVIILHIGGRVMGIVVDSVSDVITLADEPIRPAPQMGTAINTDYLIDIAHLMSADDIGLNEKLAA